MDVILFPHTHWDREWYKPFQDFRIRLIEVIDLLLEELSANNLEYFYLDGQTVILEDYLEIYPEKAARIKDFIQNKRLFIGPWYVLADEFLVSGESLARNLLIGINQAKNYGCSDFFGYLPDSFGHNSQMPKLLASFGIKNAVLWRGAGHKKSEFRWKTEDGSSILATYLTEGYFQDILHSKCSVEEKSSRINELLNRIREYSISDKILLPCGGDHLGAVLGLKDLLNQINAGLSGYKVTQDKINTYFRGLNDLESELEEVEGELRDNSRNPILPGTLSSRLYLKQFDAVSTWKLSRLADPIQSFLQNSGLSKSRKKELDYAWRLLLKNHPHDSICGCSLDEVHEENVSRFKQVNQISSALIELGINLLSGIVPQKCLAVLNLSNYSFSGVVKIKTDKKLPEYITAQLIGTSIEFPSDILLDTQRVPMCEDMQEFNEYAVYVSDIPHFSVKTASSGQQIPSVEATKDKLSNSFIEIAVNKDGSITLKDLKSNKIFTNLHIITDRPDTGDSYNYSVSAGDKPVKAEFLRAEIAEKGDLLSVLKLYYRLGEETLISTDITLKAGSKYAEFQTSWENLAENHITQIKFELPEKVIETVAENTFGLIKRTFDPDYRIEDHIPAPKGVELKTNTAPMQRFVFAQGLGIITEGLPEYGVSGNSLFVTILRATGKLSAKSLNTRAFPAGPPLDTPAGQCIGKHTVRYALCPVESPQELFRYADEFMGCVFGFVGRTEGSCGYSKSFASLNNSNILVYGVKSPENPEEKGVILRLLNISDKEQALLLNNGESGGYKELNSLEEPVSEGCNIDKELVFKPKELKSVLVVEQYVRGKF